jgi:hypothetical protein
LRKFVGKGQGPGEIFANIRSGGNPIRRINYMNGKGLLVCGFSNPKIMRFASTGKLIEEIRIPVRRSFYPVIDPDGFIYAFSISPAYGINVHDPKGETIRHRLLTEKELRRFFHFTPLLPRTIDSVSRVSESDVFYDWLTGGRFVIYHNNSSTVYIFKNFELIDQIPIRPVNALKSREKRIQVYKEQKKSKKWKEMVKKFPKLKTGSYMYFTIFMEFFVDKDSRDHLYLKNVHSYMDKPNSMYKFTSDGKLLEVLYFDLGGRKFCNFREKRNNLFYGIGRDKIYICKR